MSTSEIAKPGTGTGGLAMQPGESSGKSKRTPSTGRAASDLFGAIGWLVGLLITVIAGVVIWLIAGSASSAARQQIIINGIALAWWLNPLSFGALGYVLSNIRYWRFWTIAGLLVWGAVNALVSLSIASEPIRTLVVAGLVILSDVFLVLLFLYVQFRVFVWAASGKANRFFFGILAWAALNGLVYWALINPEVLNIILVTLGFVLRILFAIGFAVIQFVAIFWFMSRTRVEVIRPGDPKQITFDDYKGQPNLLKLVKQWISLLSDRYKFQKMGGQFINGLLLYGEPGTGKTLLAKAMAGEAGIAFISMEGSGFRAMFWGVDVLKMVSFISRARKLAREYGACIAYIDEIDAIGTSRGGVMGGGGMMGGGMGGMMGGGTGALTRLLYEMDGINELTSSEKLRARWYQFRKKPVPPRNWHVLFMGSTNRPDVLDPALTRPGRFDRTVVVNKPDRGGRREVTNYYLNKIKHDETVDVEAIVSDTAWATPARIMSAITKDAVRLALFDGRERVSQKDIELAFQEQAMGLENPIEEMQEDQRRQVAYHEAGHAVLQYYLKPEDRIVRVSIIRRSEALGYVLPVPNYDIYAQPLRRIVSNILVGMGGHVATKLFLGEYWTGAGSDFQQIRAQLWSLAYHGYFGPPVVIDPAVMASGWNFEGRGKLVEKFWQQLEDQTEQLLYAHSAEVHAVAEALLKQGDMTGKDCVEIIRAAAGVATSTNREAESERVLQSLIPNALAPSNLAEDPASKSSDLPPQATD